MIRLVEHVASVSKPLRFLVSDGRDDESVDRLSRYDYRAENGLNRVEERAAFKSKTRLN